MCAQERNMYCGEAQQGFTQELCWRCTGPPIASTGPYSYPSDGVFWLVVTLHMQGVELCSHPVTISSTSGGSCSRGMYRMVSVQVHGALAASHNAPHSAPSVTELLRLMKQTAQKPILWYLTLCGFLVSGTWAILAFGSVAGYGCPACQGGILFALSSFNSTSAAGCC
jgi:hypothetical protein